MNVNVVKLIEAEKKYEQEAEEEKKRRKNQIFEIAIVI